MKNALIGVAALLTVAVAALVGFIAMQPASTHIERSKVVAATPVDLWPLVSDLRAFTTWSPWTDLDPDQVVTFSDPSSGAGAWYTWKGNDKVGSGKMSITAVEEPTKVVEDLEFVEPFASTADVTLTLVPDGEGTKVTWAFDSPNTFMSKAFGLVVDMDAMLGADFEKGLNQLDTLAVKARSEREAAEKAAAEAAAQAALPLDPTRVEGSGVHAAPVP